MSNAIELSHICKTFGSSKALEDVSLSLIPGKFYALIGKNGSGKSTLMRILMRFEQPDRGEGSIFGENLASDRPDFNVQLGYVSELLDYSLPVTLRTFMKRIGKCYPVWDEELIKTILGDSGIDLDSYFEGLSRGQKTQFSFAMAIASRPKILLLDEITAVLDAGARGRFMNYLKEYVATGGTVLMATNIVTEVHSIADHLLLLHEGKIKLDSAFADVAHGFFKARRQQGTEHPVFMDAECIEVGTNSDGSVSYLLPMEKATQYDVPKQIRDFRGITPEELFIYFTKNRAVNHD